MTSQASTTATATAAEQGSYHWILTLELPGRAAVTQNGTYTPPAGTTRFDAYLAIREYVAAGHAELSNGIVSFFSLDSNQL
ncbi:hypothetical protein [Streptomyces sp. NBC_00239]|uniref:hypothetical protein n=1 Tax=Streptomyces sp. NBC_00239 TaxID=2903640 RepID=UPI002E2E0E48|nr:hypothetical protein [Streptomyces sp. NBC_00239]